jgi:putative FmdB family regulatory protein
VPRYDYRCTDCDQAFELRQSFSEAGKGVCPQCSGTGRRVFHAVPVIYKGSGFYTTDYGRPKPPVENGSKNEGSESSKSSDSKPAESPSQSSSESSGDSGGSSDSTSTAAASGAETG